MLKYEKTYHITLHKDKPTCDSVSDVNDFRTDSLPAATFFASALRVLHLDLFWN